MKDLDLEFKEPEFFNTAKERDAWMDRHNPVMKYAKKDGNFVQKAKPDDETPREPHYKNDYSHGTGRALDDVRTGYRGYVHKH
jgi:hypothetical protein